MDSSTVPRISLIFSLAVPFASQSLPVSARLSFTYASGAIAALNTHTRKRLKAMAVSAKTLRNSFEPTEEILKQNG